MFEAGSVLELESLLDKSIKEEIPLLGVPAREEILKNWSAEKEAENLMIAYKSK